MQRKIKANNSLILCFIQVFLPYNKPGDNETYFFHDTRVKPIRTLQKRGRCSYVSFCTCMDWDLKEKWLIYIPKSKRRRQSQMNFGTKWSGSRTEQSEGGQTKSDHLKVSLLQFQVLLSSFFLQLELALQLPEPKLW